MNKTALVNLENLRKIEWIENADGRYTCPACGAHDWVKTELKHSEGCWLGKLLKETASA